MHAGDLGQADRPLPRPGAEIPPSVGPLAAGGEEQEGLLGVLAGAVESLKGEESHTQGPSEQEKKRQKFFFL